MLKLIFYGFLLYAGYYIYKTFRALRQAAEQTIKTKQNPPAEKHFNKSDAENLDYEEVDKGR